MNVPNRRSIAFGTVTAAAIVASLGLSGCAAAPETPLPTVQSVDLQRYAGDWYEIARLPNVFQSACASDTVARYRVTDEGVAVRNRCRRADGSVDAIEGKASVVSASGGAKLQVSFFWPFRGDYWVLALGPSYEWVLVGEPRRKYAWILARTPTLDPQVLQMLLERAQSLGFDSSAFLRTPQSQGIPEIVNDPPRMDR